MLQDQPHPINDQDSPRDEYKVPQHHWRVYGMAALIVAALVHEEFIKYEPWNRNSLDDQLDAAIRIVAGALAGLNKPLFSGELDLPQLPFDW